MWVVSPLGKCGIIKHQVKWSSNPKGEFWDEYLTFLLIMSGIELRITILAFSLLYFTLIWFIRALLTSVGSGPEIFGLGLIVLPNVRARALRFGLFGLNGLNVADKFAMKFILFWPKMDQKFISALDLNFYCIFMLQFAKYYQVLTRLLKNS